MVGALLSGLVAGAGYALLAFSFGLTYFTTGIFHFAHGAIYALAAYLAWWTSQALGWPLWLAVAAGVGASAASGWLVEVGIYRPLRARRAPVDVLFLSSLGVFTVGTNLLALLFGYQARVFSSVNNASLVLRPASRPGELPLILTTVQLAILVVSAATFVLVFWLMRRTRFGLATRAYAANPVLAEVVGVDSQRLLPAVALLGGALGGLAAVALGADAGVTPEMGLVAVVTGAVAVVAGGVGSWPGAALAGLLLGVGQHLARFYWAARWEEAITFAVLLIVLLLRPRGLFGRRE